MLLPWKYNNPMSNKPKWGGKTYPEMALDDICALRVSEIANKDCVLLLWATMPKLKEALQVGEAWGFKYVTCAFNWVKLNPSSKGIYSGMGHWTNGNAELCLFFKIGKPKRLEKNIKQIQMHPRGRHSAKPSEIRDEIIRLLRDLPRIQLFARENVMAGTLGEMRSNAT